MSELDSETLYLKYMYVANSYRKGFVITDQTMKTVSYPTQTNCNIAMAFEHFNINSKFHWLNV